MSWFSRLLGRSRPVEVSASDRSTPPSRFASPPAPASRLTPVFTVLDVETTGLSPRTDRVLEMALVRLDASGAVVDEWATRFNPEGPVGATHIHGITQDDVVDAPLFRDVSNAIAARLRNSVVVAHNARFDLGFLRAEYERSGWDLPFLPAYCTLEASDHYLPNLERRRLSDCCAAAGVRLEGAHSALGDARATAGLMHRYLTVPSTSVHVDLPSLHTSALALTWPSGPSRPPVTMLPPPRPRPRRITPTRPKQPPLTVQLAALSVTDLVDDGAPEGTLTYLELLVDALEDGVLSEDESAALGDLATLYQLSSDDVASAHHAFVTALAHRALDDGHVSRDERAELHTIAGMLNVPSTTVQNLIHHADRARAARLSSDLRRLPDDWPLGEPLRVGDKVVFTGCDDAQRTRLEKRAEELGVRVMGNVSRQTTILVTDGSFAGGKAAKAAELGTRRVSPDDFEVLIAHLQPARITGQPRPPAMIPQTSAPVTRSSTDTASAAIPASPAVIRAWAAENGFTLGARGRLPRAVIDAFERAQREEN